MKNSSKNSIKRAESILASVRCGGDGLKTVMKTVANIPSSKTIRFNNWTLNMRDICKDPCKALLELEKLPSNDSRYQRLIDGNKNRVPDIKWVSDPSEVICD